MTKDNRKGIKSIETGFQIIEQVSKSDHPLTITELSELTGMPKSQLHRYLISLCRINVLERGDDLRYSLGHKLVSIGLKALRDIDIQERAYPFIKRLNEKLDETVALAVWIKDEGPTFISWEESKKPININVRIGSLVPLTNNATGNIFLAYYNREQTSDLIEREIQEKKVDVGELNTLIENVKKDGYGFTTNYLPGISAISAPVFNQHDELVAAITIVGLSESLDVSKTSVVTKNLKETAKDLSKSIGF